MKSVLSNENAPSNIAQQHELMNHGIYFHDVNLCTVSIPGSISWPRFKASTVPYPMRTRWIGLLALRVMLAKALLLISVLNQTRATPANTHRMLRASSAVDPKTPNASQRHSVGNSLNGIALSPTLDAKARSSPKQDETSNSLFYMSRFADDSARGVLRELFSAPTVLPTSAIVCQESDEDNDADLDCSFDNSNDNKG